MYPLLNTYITKDLFVYFSHYMANDVFVIMVAYQSTRLFLMIKLLKHVKKNLYRICKRLTALSHITMLCHFDDASILFSFAHEEAFFTFGASAVVLLSEITTLVNISEMVPEFILIILL